MNCRSRAISLRPAALPRIGPASRRPLGGNAGFEFCSMKKEGLVQNEAFLFHEETLPWQIPVLRYAVIGK